MLLDHLQHHHLLFKIQEEYIYPSNVLTRELTEAPDKEQFSIKLVTEVRPQPRLRWDSILLERNESALKPLNARRQKISSILCGCAPLFMEQIGTKTNRPLISHLAISIRFCKIKRLGTWRTNKIRKLYFLSSPLLFQLSQKTHCIIDKPHIFCMCIFLPFSRW